MRYTYFNVKFIGGLQKRINIAKLVDQFCREENNEEKGRINRIGSEESFSSDSLLPISCGNKENQRIWSELYSWDFKSRFDDFFSTEKNNVMSKQSIFVLVLWSILLVFTIVALAMGEKPENLVGEFLGLASPLIVKLTSLKTK